MKPTLKYEQLFWKKGYQYVAGIDEVGRGALAGPLLVSAVIFPKSIMKGPDFVNRNLREVKDSKLLSAKKRSLLTPHIKYFTNQWTIGSASVAEVNRLGIVKATYKAMRRAIAALEIVDFVLVDAFHIPYLPKLRKQKQLTIIKGDRHCFSIAAASIIAKVHRDQLMIKMGNRYPQYQLEKHKGYGTLAHRIAIRSYGPRHFHRTHFLSKILRTKMNPEQEIGPLRGSLLHRAEFATINAPIARLIRKKMESQIEP